MSQEDAPVSNTKTEPFQTKRKILQLRRPRNATRLQVPKPDKPETKIDDPSIKPEQSGLKDAPTALSEPEKPAEGNATPPILRKRSSETEHQPSGSIVRPSSPRSGLKPASLNLPAPVISDLAQENATQPAQKQSPNRTKRARTKLSQENIGISEPVSRPASTTERARQPEQDKPMSVSDLAARLEQSSLEDTPDPGKPAKQSVTISIRSQKLNKAKLALDRVARSSDIGAIPLRLRTLRESPKSETTNTGKHEESRSRPSLQSSCEQAAGVYYDVVFPRLSSFVSQEMPTPIQRSAAIAAASSLAEISRMLPEERQLELAKAILKMPDDSDRATAILSVSNDYRRMKEAPRTLLIREPLRLLSSTSRDAGAPFYNFAAAAAGNGLAYCKGKLKEDTESLSRLEPYIEHCATLASRVAARRDAFEPRNPMRSAEEAHAFIEKNFKDRKTAENCMLFEPERMGQNLSKLATLYDHVSVDAERQSPAAHGQDSHSGGRDCL